MLGHYESRVFDWYNLESDGGWDEEVPGVVLGYEKPEQLVTYLDEFSVKPLAAAKYYLKEFYEKVGSNTPLTIDEKLLDKLWNMDFGVLSSYWDMERAIRLVCWSYMTESCFYSIPDGASKVSEGVYQDVIENPGAYAVVFVDIHS
jgi:hypothetical protein